MQLCDVGLMASMKTYYSKEMGTYLRNDPEKVVTTNNICPLFGKAYNRAAIMEASINLFRKIGLFPCN